MAGLVGLALCGPAVLAQDGRGAVQLKAAFFSKFPEFVEWPSSALDGRVTMDLCVVRPNPFGDVLTGLIAGEKLNGRSLAVREVGDPKSAAPCQLLFIPELPASERRSFLSGVARLPVLTVGDSSSFMDDGGIIRLRLVDGRIGFDVNLDAANRAGLRLSAQLLRLAQSVRGGQP